MSNVQVAAGSVLDSADVLDYGAEVVIVATGAHWASDGINLVTHRSIEGCHPDKPHVLTPEQIMVDGKQPPGERVIVYDCEGYYVGSAVAERLATEGAQVALLTPLEMVAPFTAHTLEIGYLRARLHELGVALAPGTELITVNAGWVRCRNEFGIEQELAADAVVLVTQRVSVDGLYRELVSDRERLTRNGVRAVCRIGDCVAPRLLADVVFDGHRLGREIEISNPAAPLPYKREELIPDQALRRLQENSESAVVSERRPS
jgi:dimethylamine/trimethylamine dehydrogenase